MSLNPTGRGPGHPFDIDRTLFFLSGKDPYRIRDAFEGIQVFGATGSGKSSGSGAYLARSFLTAGFGGLVLCAKKDEATTWQRYAAEAGRSDQLLIVSPQNLWEFNVLTYELNRPGEGAGLTENLVNLFADILKIAEQGEGQGHGEEFWRRAVKQLLRNAIEILKISQGTLGLADIHRLIVSAPLSSPMVHDPAWQRGSFCYQCIQSCHEIMADARAVEAKTRGRNRPEVLDSFDDFEMAAYYFLSEFPNIAEKTRSVIVSTFTSMSDPFLRKPFRNLFCKGLNFGPEMTHHGYIIVMDLPLKEYGEVGRIAQVLVKTQWQQATERRDVRANPRPVFLWADESQFFITPHDQSFQTTARSSHAATVYLTQNLPNYYRALGGEGGAGKATVDSLLGNLQTKIFHQNGEQQTNVWAAELFGKSWQMRLSYGRTLEAGQGRSAFSPGGHMQAGGSQSLEYNVQPAEFITLRKGGPANRGQVEAIVFHGGRTWAASGKTNLKVTFRQG